LLNKSWQRRVIVEPRNMLIMSSGKHFLSSQLQTYYKFRLIDKLDQQNQKTQRKILNNKIYFREINIKEINWIWLKNFKDFPFHYEVEIDIFLVGVNSPLILSFYAQIINLRVEFWLLSKIEIFDSWYGVLNFLPSVRTTPNLAMLLLANYNWIWPLFPPGNHKYKKKCSKRYVALATLCI